MTTSVIIGTLHSVPNYCRKTLDYVLCWVSLEQENGSACRSQGALLCAGSHLLCGRAWEQWSAGGGGWCQKGELVSSYSCSEREIPPQPVCSCMITAFLWVLPTSFSFLKTLKRQVIFVCSALGHCSHSCCSQGTGNCILPPKILLWSHPAP